MIETRFERSASRHETSDAPPAVIQTFTIAGKAVHVVREDLLPGGSKQRACIPLLKILANRGHQVFFYASPFCGYAQVALAYSCRVLGLSCHLYCERDLQGGKHAFTALAESYGARITLVDSLLEAEAQAEAVSEAAVGGCKIPLGFDCDEFKIAYESALREQWQIIQIKLNTRPKRLWLPVGSGTLASVFAKVLDEQTKVIGVNVNIFTAEHVNLQRLTQNPKIMLMSALEQFHEVARVRPPIESNIHYDAKIWQFLLNSGEEGDVWWNVGK